MKVCFTIFHYGLLAKLLAIVSHRSRRFFDQSGTSVQAWTGGRKSDGFDEVGMLEDNVREDVAGHPVGQEKLKGFHHRELRGGCAGVVEVAFVHRPDLEVVAVAFRMTPEFPFPVLFRGH